MDGITGGSSDEARPSVPLARKSAIVKRSVELNGHKTSVSLEDEFWQGLQQIAAEDHKSMPELLQSIDADRGHSNLSSAIRVYVLRHYTR